MILWVFAPLVAACSAGPIAWEEAVTLPSAIDANPRVEALPAGGPWRAPGACVAGGRLARDTAAGREFVVWWRVRADSSSDLLASMRIKSGAWSSPVRIDTADVGRAGCDRPPPAISLDGDLRCALRNGIRRRRH